MIPKFSTTSISPAEFLVDFALANEACLLDESFTADWPAMKQWCTLDGRPNFEHLLNTYGEAQVPVLIGALNIEHCGYTTLTLRKFVERFIQPKNRETIAYLKDWHFQNQFPDSHVYKLPCFLAMDWINGEEWTNKTDNFLSGDYRFVYFGTAGSWTPFHADVMESFSWSANVCGRKQWYLLRRGAERHFLVDGASTKDAFITDLRERRDRWLKAGLIEFVQKPGEIVFVPSGWYHQVYNLDDTISINHNVINACNVNFLRVFVERRLGDVQREIADLKEQLTSIEFAVECQKILLADCRMNMCVLDAFMNAVLASRGGADALALLSHTGDDALANAVTTLAGDLNARPPNTDALSLFKRALLAACECSNGGDDCTKMNGQFCAHCARIWGAFERARADAVKRSLSAYLLENGE